MTSDAQGRGSDRRIAARADRVLEVRYRNAGHFLVSYCTNLSRGGLFVTTRTPLPIGTPVTLQLHLPRQAEPVECQAEVRWIRADDPDGVGGMGLCFEGLDELIGASIDDIVGDFEPLSIALVGDPQSVWQHVTAILVAILRSRTTHFNCQSVRIEELRDSDLIVIDADAAPAGALRFLGELGAREHHPPVLALCSARNEALRTRLLALTEVVSTPIDSDEFQAMVLRTLSRAPVRLND